MIPGSLPRRRLPRDASSRTSSLSEHASGSGLTGYQLAVLAGEEEAADGVRSWEGLDAQGERRQASLGALSFVPRNSEDQVGHACVRVGGRCGYEFVGAPCGVGVGGSVDGCMVRACACVRACAYVYVYVPREMGQEGACEAASDVGTLCCGRAGGERGLCCALQACFVLLRTQLAVELHVAAPFGERRQPPTGSTHKRRERPIRPTVGLKQDGKACASRRESAPGVGWAVSGSSLGAAAAEVPLPFSFAASQTRASMRAHAHINTHMHPHAHVHTPARALPKHKNRGCMWPISKHAIIPQLVASATNNTGRHTPFHPV